jgi:hypothetical protein
MLSSSHDFRSCVSIAAQLVHSTWLDSPRSGLRINSTGLTSIQHAAMDDHCRRWTTNPVNSQVQLLDPLTPDAELETRFSRSISIYLEDCTCTLTSALHSQRNVEYYIQSSNRILMSLVHMSSDWLSICVVVTRRSNASRIRFHFLCAGVFLSTHSS